MKYKLFLPIILLIALATRLWNYTAIALWHDEAFSALLIRMPFSEMMHRIALDVHPPFYYWLLDVWAVFFGHSLASLRGFSVFFGVATVAMLYILIKDVTQSHKLALGAAALLAVNPFHIQYSLEARMYTLGTFLIVASSWVLFRALAGNKWRFWVAYSILTAAALLTHYFLLFSVVAQGLFVLVWRSRAALREAKSAVALREGGWRWFWSYVLALALYAFWLPTFLKQLTQVQENYWIPQMDIWSIPNTIWKIMLGGFQGAPHNTLIAATVIFALILLLFVSRYHKFFHCLIVFMVVIPFVLATLASMRTAIFLDRYFIFAAVFMAAITAMALLSLKWKKTGPILLIALMAASVISYGLGFQKIDAKNRPGMAAASDYVLDHYPIRCPQNAIDTPEHIIVGSTFIYFNYRYYHEMYFDPIRGAQLSCEMTLAPHATLYLPGIDEVADLPHFSGTALLENKDFVSDLTTLASTGQEVLLLWTTGFSGSKPEVPSNWIQTSEQKFPDVFQHKGEIYVTKYLVR